MLIRSIDWYDIAIQADENNLILTGIIYECLLVARHSQLISYF